MYMAVTEHSTIYVIYYTIQHEKKLMCQITPQKKEINYEFVAFQIIS
jgi:hypothetical protein